MRTKEGKGISASDYSKKCAHLRIQKCVICSKILSLEQMTFSIICSKYPSRSAKIINESDITVPEINPFYELVFGQMKIADSQGFSVFPQFFFDFVGVKEMVVKEPENRK